MRRDAPDSTPSQARSINAARWSWNRDKRCSRGQWPARFPSSRRTKRPALRWRHQKYGSIGSRIAAWIGSAPASNQS